MTEREPMSSKEQLKEAYMAGVAHHTNEEVGFPEETFSRWYDALASTEPEQPAAWDKVLKAGRESAEGRLPAILSPEHPASEGEEKMHEYSDRPICESCHQLMTGVQPELSAERDAYFCESEECQVEPSTTEGEQELLPFVLGILEDFENRLTGGGAGRSDEEHRIRENHADRILALLAQPQEPTAPSKKWTPAALEEWTPEQWAAALDAARSDLMCAEDFEPSDVAHVMNICAQVLRRPREQGERIEGKRVRCPSCLYEFDDDEPQEQGEPNDCRDCGAPHWYNFMVPDDVWKKIAPDQPCLPEEGGMLCAQCIDKRCAALGIEAEGKFYFKGKAVVSRYPDEQGERIWIKPHELADLRDDANGIAIIESRDSEDGDDAPDFLRTTLIIYPDPEPAGGEDG